MIIKLRKYMRKQHINEKHTVYLLHFLRLDSKVFQGQPASSCFSRSANCCKQVEEKRGPEERERVYNLHVDLLFRPLAHMSKRRARFDVGCLKAW